MEQNLWNDDFWNIFLPRNNPRYPPIFPINEWMSTSFDCVMILTSSGYSIAIDHVVTYWGYGPLKFVSLESSHEHIVEKVTTKIPCPQITSFWVLSPLNQIRILINKLMHFLTIATLLQNKQNFQTTTIKKI